MQNEAVKASAAVMGAITGLGGALLLFSDDLPDVALAAAASVAISGAVTLIWLLGQGSRSVQSVRDPQTEGASEQLRILLEDTRKLRAQTEELHKHLIDALDESVPSAREKSTDQEHDQSSGAG